MKSRITLFCITLTASVLAFSILLGSSLVLASSVIILVEGNREVTIGSNTLNFGNIQVSDEENTLTGVTLGTDGIIIDDMYSNTASWSVSVAANNFVGTSTSQEIAYTNIAVIPDDDGVVDKISGTTGTEGISTSNTLTSLTGTGDISDDLTLVSADSRERTARYQTFPEFQLTVPALLNHDSFSNTFTFTFIVN